LQAALKSAAATPKQFRNEGGLYAMRCPDGGYVVFAAESVTRLLDVPAPAAQ
jgi:hypothetical protein